MINYHTNKKKLVFSKGDVITVTQPLEGGWWEGTLNGKTGWFPSNYVKEVKLDGVSLKEGGGQVTKMDMAPHSNMQFYHNVVLHNVIETEKMHVSDISAVLQKYVRPLRVAGILTSRTMVKLVDQLEEICTLKRNFLTSFEETARVSHSQRRVGGVFIKYAPKMRVVFEAYCTYHPGAIADVQTQLEEINENMESLGAPSPGSLVLITCLSQPFTRLEKYSSLLKELERHIEENHIDRGDTQRAITIYREISTSCFEIRKRKEMEHEIISNVVKGWEGEDMCKLGEVIHISKCKVSGQGGERLDRIMMLFPSTLILLSISPRMSGYHYEGKIALTGLQVNMCEDKENFPNSFELSGGSIERLVFMCGTNRDMHHWTSIIHDQLTSPSHTATKPPNSLPVASSSPVHISTTPLPPTSPTVKTSTSTSTLPCRKSTTQRTWTMSCLCPAPPLRPVLNYNDTLPHRKSGNVRKKQDDPRMYEMDGAILRVIEAYCNSAKSRHTVGSSVFEMATVILPEEEKLIIETEPSDARTTILEEKSLVDTVYSLNTQVNTILQEQKKLRQEIEDERKSRRILESTVRKLQKLYASNIGNGDVVSA